MSIKTSREIASDALKAALWEIENNDQYTTYRLSKGKQKKVKQTTKQAKTQQGQILTWTAESLKRSIEIIVSGTKGLEDNKKEIPLAEVQKLCAIYETDLLEKWEAKNPKDKMSPERRKRVAKDYNKHIKTKFPGTYSAPVLHYRSAVDIKQDKLSKLVVSLVKKALDLKSGSESLKILSGTHPSQGKKGKKLGSISAEIDIGHGTHGSFSSGQLRSMQMKRLADEDINNNKDLTRKEKQNARRQINKAFREASGIFRDENETVVTSNEKLATKLIWQRVFNKDGSFKENFVQVLTLELASENQAKGTMVEQAFQRRINAEAENLILASGSMSMVEAITASILKTFLTPLRKGSYKLKSKIKPKYDKQKKNLRSTDTATRKTRIKIKKFNPILLVSPQKIEGLMNRGEEKGADKDRNSGLLQLQGILNTKLPDTVRENMRAPTLVNRTGRFAGSVSVPSVTRTRQNFISIGYTYMRKPYQIFEDRGQRDPRSLIDKSIREIMAGQAKGRLYTRRL